MVRRQSSPAWLTGMNHAFGEQTTYQASYGQPSWQIRPCSAEDTHSTRWTKAIIAYHFS